VGSAPSSALEPETELEMGTMNKAFGELYPKDLAQVDLLNFFLLVCRRLQTSLVQGSAA